jgi:hypothetical protein
MPLDSGLLEFHLPLLHNNPPFTLSTAHFTKCALYHLQPSSPPPCLSRRHTHTLSHPHPALQLLGSERPVMVCGLDVTHPGADGRDAFAPSIGALVASMDPGLTR